MAFHPHVQDLLGRFQIHVARLLNYDRSRQVKGIGLALSGGVDSIALAWLWHTSKTLPSSGDEHTVFSGFQGIPFRAIIINHKLRPESDQDVLETRHRYKQLTGQDPIIVDLDWDAEGGSPASSRLETSARRLRYRALGRVCRKHGLDVLLTGHHADDNAETVLSRILRGVRGTGLRGIAPISAIPECDGLQEVAERLPRAAYVGGSELSLQWTKSPLQMKPGIRVVRPLLPFEKQELSSLCRHVGIQWAEDATNSDPTLTQRNAIRSLLQSHKLPKAFSKTSLEKLATKQRDARARLRSEVHELNRQTQKVVDTASGVLSFILPDPQVLQSYSDAVRSLFVRELLSSVSAHSEVPLKDCTVFSRRMFECNEELLLGHPAQSQCSQTSKRTSRTRSGIKTSVMIVGGIAADATARSMADASVSVMWRFTQQASSAPRRRNLRVWLKDHGDDRHKTPDYPYATLWDGRFWLKAEICTADVLAEKTRDEPDADNQQANGGHRFLVRCLTVDDVAELRRLAKMRSGELIAGNANTAFSRYRSKPRFGTMTLPLPVIAEVSVDESTESDGRLIAFPAIDFVRHEYQPAMKAQMFFKAAPQSDEGPESACPIAKRKQPA